MSKNKGDLGHIQGCYRCGEIKPESIETERGLKCGSCGEINTIVTFTQAMDLLNNFFVKGEPILVGEGWDERTENLNF